MNAFQVLSGTTVLSHMTNMFVPTVFAIRDLFVVVLAEFFFFKVCSILFVVKMVV